MPVTLHCRAIEEQPLGRDGKAKPIRTYPRGRVCAEPACDTPLSRYNSEPYCVCHARPAMSTAARAA